MVRREYMCCNYNQDTWLDKGPFSQILNLFIATIPLLSAYYVPRAVRSVSCSVMSNSFWPHGLQPARLLCHGILQARILEWVAISFSRGSSRPRDQIRVSCIAGNYHLSHQGSPIMGKTLFFSIDWDYTSLQVKQSIFLSFNIIICQLL